MEFQLGETYSGYEFLGIIQRSKNGVEYRVRNTRSGRLEALRSLPLGAQDDQEQTNRFLREMRVHASLLHPNIVTLFNVIELENQPMITTELVDGTTLAQKLRGGPLPWREAVSLCQQAIAALNYAHLQKIVHRGICPENILISSAGVLKVANFTLAKAESSPKLTQVGTTVGDVKYISPEQIWGVAEVDGRSDIYSVGMVLYEMLCGHPAFERESQFELMSAQVNQTPAAPHSINPAIPEEVSAAVLKAVAKDPAARFQTAAEFGEALLKASDPASASAAMEQPASPIEEKGPAATEETLSPGDIPAFLAAAGVSNLSRKHLMIGGAAGACMGVLIMCLWLFVK